MKKSLLILLSIIFAINLNIQAHHFYAEHNGDTIYYNITSSTSPRTVEVTFRGSFYNSLPIEYSGTVSIPDSVQYSGNYYKVTSIGGDAFNSCTSLTSITIPNSVISIGSSAFYNCYSLSSITIPNSVISIGSYAFSYCYGLISITIPNSVISIGGSAFSYCTGLTSITIPNSITSIGSSAFSGLSGLTSITIPNSVTSIGDYAFSSCTSLTSITIPNSVTSIGGSAFRYCYGLTSITIPNSVTSIGNYAFAYCTGLTSITIPNSVTSIRDNTFYNCYSLSSITIPNSVISIGSYAFYGCSGLTSITIPNSVTSIGDDAFTYCRGLTSITIPNSVTSIRDNTFYNCYSLSSITIPNSVTSIGNNAFSYCYSLSSITSKAINPPAVQGNSFFGVSKTIPFNLPCISIQSYQSNSYWNEFTNKIGGSPRAAQFITTSICPGETYTDYGANINTAGDYTLVNGCDSVILNLSIKPTFQTDYYDTICKGQNYNNYGFSFVADTSGIYKYNLQAVNSCDSVICLNLFVNPIYNDTILAEICSNETYNLNGFNVNTAGFYTQNLQTTKGCDSVVNLNLIVNPIYLTNHFDTICKGQLYNNYGFNFTSDTSGFYTQNLQTIKGCDSIINLNLIVNPIYNDTIIAEICNGETYSQFGFNENTAGFYTQSLQTIKGCDSIINLNLIVNPIYNDTIIAEICNGETYSQFGFNENTAGFYTQSLQTIKGCDSIVNLNLIINPIYNDTILAEICSNETYTLNGFNVYTAGFYTQNLQTIKGCDSVVNLNLIVNPIYLTNHFDTICKGQLYNNYGFNFTSDTSGFYTQNLQTIKGCDSIINLNLIVNPIYNDTILAEICSNETYTLNGFNVNTAGFYTQNLQTIKGCDSIVNLSLIVNPIYNDTIIAEICQGQTYSQYGFNVNTTGFYTQNLQTIKGCDSIVNLSLIVNPIYNDTIIAEICQGQTYSQYGFNVNTTGFYTQNLQTIKGCDSIVCLSLVVREPIKVNLTMVTVDNNNNNVVVWDKDEVVNHYNIYRESNVANQFDLISTVSFDSASMYVDTNSNPTIKAYMYKISTTDTCLNESELSPFHKTMHLTIGQGMGNNWNLSWTPYVGANYSTYNIYRGINTLDSLKFLTTISSNNTSYTDVNVPSGYVYYQVEIIIDTTQSKANENSIRSNYATNDPLGIVNYSQTNISTKLYPNPTEGKAKLEIEGLSNDADVIVSDLLGRVIKKYKFNSEKGILEIDVSGYPKGVYSVSVQNNNINVSKKLIVQ